MVPEIHGNIKFFGGLENTLRKISKFGFGIVGKHHILQSKGTNPMTKSKIKQGA